MAIIVGDLLTIFGAMVAFCIGMLMIILFFDLAKARKVKLPEAELAGEDFFTQIGNISSDVAYFSGGLFSKNFQFEFRKIGGGKPLALLEGEMKSFAKVTRLVHMADITAVFFAKLAGNSGKLMAKLAKAQMQVKMNANPIGKIDFVWHLIFDADGKKIGSFEKNGMKISGADIMGIPFLGKRENFSVSQSVYFGEKMACTIVFRKWPDAQQPLFVKVDKRLGKEELALLFALASAEWAMSLNLRE